MKKIKLTKGKYVIVDDEDFNYLSRFNWYIKSDFKKETNHIFTLINNKAVGIVYFLVNYKEFENKPFEIAHKNKNQFDCRKENLIVLSRSAMRQFNRKREDNTTGFKGVWVCKNTQKYVAEISKNNKKYYIGRFESLKEAGLAYNKKAKELYGDNAYQNIIE